MKLGGSLACEGLTYRYPGSAADALAGVDLLVERGKMYAVLGRNGSGKSTLAMCLGGLLEPREGSVVAGGARMGMIFQDPDTQMVASSVEEEVAFGPENLGLESAEIRRRVDGALDRVGIADLLSRQPLRLSQGQKQLVAVAGALAMRPEFMLSDESTSMLDHAARSRVLNLFEGLAREGMGVVHVTHFISEAVRADEVVVLDDGRVALQGPPGEVLSDPGRLESLGLEPLPVTLVVSELSSRGREVPAGTIEPQELLSWLRS